MATLEQIARVTHEANRGWCAANGDFSQPTWDEAPEWQRESALKGVVGAIMGNTPEQSHEGWLDEKLQAGWIYGELAATSASSLTRRPTSPIIKLGPILFSTW